MKIFLVLMLCAGQVLAEPLKFVPPWHMTGNEACYDLAGAKKLAELDNKVVTHEQQCIALFNEKENYRLSVDAMFNQIGVIQTENQRLSTELQQAIKDKNNALAASGGTPTTWLVIGGAGVLVLGVIVGAYIIKH